jgi:hypothetical protein
MCEPLYERARVFLGLKREVGSATTALAGRIARGARASAEGDGIAAVHDAAHFISA